MATQDLRDGSLIRDTGQRYLWLWQTDSREKICGTEIIQVDLGSLHSAGSSIGTARLNEVLQEGNASEKRLAALGRGEEFGDAAERFEDVILALQSVGGGRGAFLWGHPR